MNSNSSKPSVNWCELTSGIPLRSPHSLTRLDYTMKNNTDFTQRTFQRESMGGETRAKEEKKVPNNRRRLFHSTGTPLQTRSRPQSQIRVNTG
ncbi:hypothetical protein V1478_018054 [Vespula squamosa]|uniref:Uncharacterized protein n=1 Tax=Vespula squamosa TaxID=30214 RepID=A0ABD1ZVZ3_VESSQ